MTEEAGRRGDLRERFGRAATGAVTPWLVDRPSDKPAGKRKGQEDASETEAVSIKSRLLERLIDEIGDREFLEGGEEAVKNTVHEFVAEVLETEDVALNESERQMLVDDLTEETLGLGPLAPLMTDPAITDILVNGPNQVYVERFGRLSPVGVRFRDADHVIRLIERMAARVGRRIDMASPMLDARLADGSRVNATIPPVSLDGPTISIRRFGTRRLRANDLLRMGEFSSDMLQFISTIVRERANVLISGGTGAGKSTLLGALAEAIPETERIVTIEDTAELILDQDHVVRLETRPANIEGSGTITARDLVINCLRMRPDRIIVGEVRGGEALDMLQAMNTGHDGGLCTLHSNSARDGLARLETMVLMAGLELPSRAIREQIVSALEFVIHVRRYEDGVRRVESMAEVVGLEGGTPLLNEIFRFKRTGRTGRRVTGRFEATGIVPRFLEKLRVRRIEVPAKLFHRPEGERE